MLSRLSADLADGALGIGILLGYAPAVSPDEYLQVAGLAATAGVPTFTHARDLIEWPRALVDGAEEIVRAAGQTGAHMHYCHVNSTSQRHIDRGPAWSAGLRPPGRGSAPRRTRTARDDRHRGGVPGARAARRARPDPSSLTYAPTGERVASADRLRELRAADPGGLVIIDLLDEDDPADRALLMRALSFPGGVVASDAMPLTWTAARPTRRPGRCRRPRSPIPGPRARSPGAAPAHPREADRPGRGAGQVQPASRPGCCRTVCPPCAPRAGLQAGGDADIVVFDPAAIADRASYRHSTRPSAGISHVLVNGAFVVRDGDIVPARGRAARSAPSRAEPGGLAPRRITLRTQVSCTNKLFPH